MKLLLLFIGVILYGRAGTVAADSMIEAPKPETGSPGDAEEIQVAEPPPLVFKGAEDFVAVPATKRFNRTDKAKRPGAEAVNTSVNVKPGKPQILPMPIAVGEPSPQKPIVFTLDGYLYEGAQKIASYRIDFRGVHFKKEKKDDVVVTLEDGDDGEKATTAKPVDVNGATTEAQTPVDAGSATTEAVRPTEDNDDQKANTERAVVPTKARREDPNDAAPTKPTEKAGSATTEAVYPVTDNVNGATTEAQTPVDDKWLISRDYEGLVPDASTRKAIDIANGATTNAQTLVDETVGPSVFTKPWAVDGEATKPQAVETKEEEKTTEEEAEVASTAVPIAPGSDASTKAPTAPESIGSTTAPIAPEAVASTKAPVDPEDVASTKVAADKEDVASTKAPIAPEAVGSTKAPIDPEVDASTAAPTPEADGSTKARVPRESDSSTEAPVALNEGASSTVPAPAKDVLFTGVPPKPEIWQDKEGKCTEALTFAFDAKAGRCLANKTYVCKEEEWAAVLKKTFGECMKSAPKVAPADDNVKSDCGLGKVYAKVPGEPSADLYGKLCKYEFCPKEATCVQDKTAAHCCIMPMWAHYG